MISRVGQILSLILVLLGGAIIVRTVAAGAGVTPAMGYLLGGALILIGGARLWLAQRLGSPDRRMNH